MVSVQWSVYSGQCTEVGMRILHGEYVQCTVCGTSNTKIYFPHNQTLMSACLVYMTALNCAPTLREGSTAPVEMDTHQERMALPAKVCKVVYVYLIS